MKNLNVNETVIVKLSILGKEVWQEHADVTSSRYSDPVLYDSMYNREMKKLKEDTLEAPLWEVMNVFGKYMNTDIESPFASDIKIKEKSLY